MYQREHRIHSFSLESLLLLPYLYLVCSLYLAACLSIFLFVFWFCCSQPTEADACTHSFVHLGTHTRQTQHSTHKTNTTQHIHQHTHTHTHNRFLSLSLCLLFSPLLLYNSCLPASVPNALFLDVSITPFVCTGTFYLYCNRFQY